MSALLCSLFSLAVLTGGQDSDATLKKAAEMFKQGDKEKAIALVSDVIKNAPQQVEPLVLRAAMYAAQQQHTQAVADYDKALSLSPKMADVYHARGCEQFRLGKFAESVRDFDKQIELQPDAKISHWQRGISHYYAKQFKNGQQQFEGYQEFDSKDVENGVWRYLCMARAETREKARTAMLKIGEDRRVPMKEIYEMFRGKLKPDDVLAAAQAGNLAPEQRNRALFYAHLYLGLFYESEDQPQKALHHLALATDHRIGHYMWDVARVHRDLLKTK